LIQDFRWSILDDMIDNLNLFILDF
jgi:hypothetical protein